MARLYSFHHLLIAVLVAAAMVILMPNDSEAQDTITTSSGLRYIDHEAGAGEKAEAERRREAVGLPATATDAHPLTHPNAAPHSAPDGLHKPRNT